MPNVRSPGVYSIAYSERNITNAEFAWCREIIYFGVADHIGKRLNQFDKTISGKKNSHGGADRARFKYQEYSKLIPRLYVAIAAIGKTPAQNSPDCWRRKGDARQFEYHCIAEYLEKYGQLPTFNNQNSPKFSQQILDF